MKSALKIVIFAFLFSGCSTIYFQNGPEANVITSQTEWHHDGIIELVEFSDPVDLSNRCQGRDWKTVKTYRGVLQVLINLIPYVSYVWTPWEVDVECNYRTN